MTDEPAVAAMDLRHLAESIPHLVWSLSPDASDAYLSPRWFEYTGQPASISLPDAWLGSIHPEDRDLCFAQWAQAGATRTPWQVEFRLRRHDGQYRWHVSHAVPHCGPDGEISRWYGTTTDIHAQREAMRSRDNVLATVSHDLRGPLSAILLAAESLEELNPERREIGVIYRSVKNMERLIQDLLDLASIESGHLKIKLSSCAIEKLIDEALDGVQRTVGAKQITITKEIAEPGLRVQCDRGRALQVLGNLLGNAVKFTPPQGRISIRAARAGRFVLFAVSDTGLGIDAAQLPLIFDRFWQAKDTAKAGTGLGLAICKGIVEGHGGSISVESEPDAGSTFFFTLPGVDG